MESYCNMNSSNGRQYRNPRNQGCNSCERIMQERTHHRMQDCRNKTVEVECSCKVTKSKDCYKYDEMERLGEDFPVVMSYVPWQQWGEMYDAECGLMQGTIFKDLNFIFCGVRC